MVPLEQQQEQQQEMADLWNELPPELCDKIIAHVQAPEVLALRSVSRHWNSLISCPRFLRFCGEIPRAEQWMLVPKWPLYTGMFAFLPESEKWISIPFGLSLNLHVESSMHGDKSLLLLRTPDYSFPQRLHIYSPLLRSSKQIIRCNGLVRGTAVLIHEQSCDGSTNIHAQRFRIIALSSGSSSSESTICSSVSSLQAISYDSVTGSWTTGGLLPRDVVMSNAQKRQSLLVDLNHLKETLMLIIGERDERQELLIYQIHKEKWGCQVQLPESSVEVKSWVIHCQSVESMVFLVQMNPFRRTVCVWRLPAEDLVKRSKKCKWVCEAPEVEIDERFVDEDNCAAVEDCIGLGDKIIVCKFPNYLCYQIGGKGWNPLPAPPEKPDCVSRAFVFCPKLM